MPKDSRTENSIKNISYAIIGYAVSLFLQLANRLVFVKLLSAEYLGISGLFTNVLSLLSLSELGVGAAIVFALYKPVAENDIEKIKSLMSLYKRLYSIIGSIILVVGLLLTPFLKYIIKEMPDDIPLIYLYYMLYVINSGISYFYTYKRSLIICNQEEYISTTTTMVASVGTKILQIVVLLLFKNYTLFLLVQIGFTRIENLVISKIADRRYPFLKEKNIVPLSTDEKLEIKTNVFAMMLHKIGSVVVNATDNLIISKILGLVSVGFMSNYSMIFDTVNSLITKVFSAITASIGNMAVLESKEKSEKVLYRILFANFWIVSFCTICCFCLCQPFISLWLGDKYVLSIYVLAALCGCFYLTGMRLTVLQFRTALGLFVYDKYKAILEAVLNLAISIPMTMLWGIAGVKLGTIISMLLTSFWIEGFILFRKYFSKSTWHYFRIQFLYLGLTLLMCGSFYLIFLKINSGSMWSFLLMCFICASGVNLIYFVLFRKTDSFSYFKNLLARKIFARLKR